MAKFIQPKRILFTEYKKPESNYYEKDDLKKEKVHVDNWETITIFFESILAQSYGYVFWFSIVLSKNKTY